MTHVLSFYPIANDFRGDLETKLEVDLTPRYLGEFRHPDVIRTWSNLRALGREDLVLAIEEPEARAAAALLLAVGAIFGPRGVRAFDRQLMELPVSRARGWASLLTVGWDSFVARLEARTMARELATSRWSPEPWRGGKRAAYLKTTLHYGVKAGGSVGHVAGVVNSLANVGFRPHVYAIEPQPLVHATTPLTRLIPPSLFAFPAEFNLIRFHYAVVDQMRTHLKAHHGDWIYQRLSNSNFAGAVLSKQMHLPLVVEYNGSAVWVAKNWGNGMLNEAMAQTAEDALLKQATLVVTISDVLHEELLARGIPDRRIFSHPNCVDPERYRPDLFSRDEMLRKRKAMGIAPDEMVLTFLGTFGVWHGVDFLAESIKALYEQDPGWWEDRKLRLLMVGDGVLRGKAEELLADVPRVTFTGLVPQADGAGYLAISDVLLSPHVDRKSKSSGRFFGSPTKLFEYMAMRKAIVASDLEQIGEVLSPGHRVGRPLSPVSPGCLFTPGDHTEFIAAIRWSVENPAARESMGAAARARVLESFTWQRFAERLEQRLEGLHE
ncbi:MAG: glycosyltransferase family 4 protein [Actinomycetota bacterium]